MELKAFKQEATQHDDVIKWKHFPHYWPFVRGIHQWPMNSPDKGQWQRALMFSLICVWTNRWVNSRDAGDFRRHRPHYDVTVMRLLADVDTYNLQGSLQRRQNKHDGVSSHRRLNGLLKGLFRRRLNKTSKLLLTGLCEGNSPVTGGFPSASNAENASIWWPHHVHVLHWHWANYMCQSLGGISVVYGWM